jgi:hypothetical protein
VTSCVTTHNKCKTTTDVFNLTVINTGYVLVITIVNANSSIQQLMLTVHVSELDWEMAVRPGGTAFWLKACHTRGDGLCLAASYINSFCKWLLVRGLWGEALTRTPLCSADKSPFLCPGGFRSKTAGEWPGIPTVPYLSGLWADTHCALRVHLSLM